MSTRRTYILNYFVVDAILSAYRYCFREENKNNTTHVLIDENTSNDYLMDVMESLTMLEDLVSRSYTDVVASYFESKAIEKTIQKEREPQSKGGRIRAENEAKRLEPDKLILKNKWDQENWTSKGRGKYTNFANKVVKEDLVESMDFDAIRTLMSKYDQNKL